MNVKLRKQEFPSVGEVVYQAVLTNGMKLVVIPKHEYQEVYGIITTRFGSVDTMFTDYQGEVYNYPAGIAHFLEHKLFEDSQGKDILQKFSIMGAESNAFTGYTRTSYLFSTTNQNQVKSCLDLLLEIVENLSVTEESIARESEITGQEIDMYKDQPDDRLFYQTLANLYPHTPIAQDIAGSRDSIKLIGIEELKENFNHFYQPANMVLVLVGKIDPEEIFKYLNKKEHFKVDKGVNLVHHKKIALYPVVRTDSMRMEIANPKLAIGLRGKDLVEANEMLRYKTILKILFTMMFGWTSQRFQRLYESGKIDHSLTLEVEVEEAFHFVILTMDVEEPVSLSHALRSAIRNFASDPDVTEEHLDIVKSEMFGDFLHSLNSLDFIATEYNPYLERENLFDIPLILQNIRLKDVLEVGQSFIDNCDMIDFTIFPK